MKISKQSSSSSRHHSERKLKKKRPPNYYRQEYQQMLEPATLNQQQQQINGQKDETTPIQTRAEEPTTAEPIASETNLFLLPNGDERYNTCDQWVHSTMQHRQNDDDDRSSSKQSLNDDEEIDSESHGTSTDTENENELQHSSSTTRPSFPVNIERNLPIQDNSIGNAQHLTPQNNDLNIYSTSVASGASIETLKPSNDPPSPVKQAKPSSWADLFRSQAQANASAVPSPPPPPPAPVPTPTSTVNKPQPAAEPSATAKSNANNFYSRTNYHVYNSNGGESKSLEGSSSRRSNDTFLVFSSDYFSKCEVRPSAMAIKPRGLTNKNNYCYVNAVSFPSLLFSSE